MFVSRSHSSVRLVKLPVECLVQGRGTGSHQIHVIKDADGKEIGRFGLTDHPKDVSWTVLSQVEDSLAHLFGKKWMEK